MKPNPGQIKWVRIKDGKNEYSYITNKNDINDESRLSVLSTFHELSTESHNTLDCRHYFQDNFHLWLWS